jgi:hypothetical protein
MVRGEAVDLVEPLFEHAQVKGLVGHIAEGTGHIDRALGLVVQHDLLDLAFHHIEHKHALLQALRLDVDPRRRPALPRCRSG